VYTLIAAETLGVNPGRISMPRPDTFSAVESGPTVASRATIVGGNATRVTAARLGRLLTEAAADALDCSVDQIDRQGEDFVSPTGRVLGFDQVVAHARAMGLELATSGRWESPPIKWDFDAGIGEPYFAYSFGAQVIEVTVDTVSGTVDAVGVWAARVGGQVIFPQGAFGQMYGGIAQGLGYGILERVEFNRGRIRNDNFDEYLIPTAADVPEMQATFLTRTFDEGPYGAKNMAEPPLLPVAPAVANAVHPATGRRIRHLPASLERVLLGHELSR
jgi:CO/xanthine dehydrogenase Mo-binding subunit